MTFNENGGVVAAPAEDEELEDPNPNAGAVKDVEEAKDEPVINGKGLEVAEEAVTELGFEKEEDVRKGEVPNEKAVDGPEDPNENGEAEDVEEEVLVNENGDEDCEEEDPNIVAARFLYAEKRGFVGKEGISISVWGFRLENLEGFINKKAVSGKCTQKWVKLPCSVLYFRARMPN